MSPPIDDEDLSLSISHSQGRRNSREPNGAPQALNPNPRIPNQPAKQSKQGERLGQYNIVKTLGEGSFGKVKLANHHISGQKVALKIMSRRKLVTRDMAGRIEREIQYLQLLRHPHIIKLYTVITLPSEIVMVLEYAGGELFDYIVTHGKMAEDKARKFFQQIVCAVEYCHRHKIVHRDLKPENLLLDENLNVKIADFGLSNIMTDGNFLKTSCGSPNYAAPEVISGKLYAGPEVDVWSCGVILYVLLVGRLPFDDEYIPALFKKIASGNYMLPNYLSSGAKRLIGRMLQVNPVNRITIQDIRQDPWFMKDLADYLQPPVEDFLDTGVDPNKAIDPHALAKGKPVAVQERMHASIVGKLGKTMGYAPDDVQEALAMDEPSAIKDAYLIVRENHLMKNNPSLAADQPAFVAQSPPAISSMPMSPNVKITSAQPTGIEHPRHGSVGSNSIKMEARSPASTIAVLPSSLPDYHKAFMKGQVHKTASQAVPEDVQAPKTKEEQEARIRALKPHSRSSTNVRSMGERPEPLTSIPEAKAKKPKQQKWQFGIRSRNTPCEAMLAIYRALAKMGASWEVPRPKDPGAGSGEGSPDRDRDRDRNRQHEGSQSPEYSDSDPEAGTDPEYATHEEQEHRRRMREQAASNPRRGRERYGRWNDYGYDIPEDPWVINARFRKDDMFPPGVAHPSSNHSSRADLHSSSGSGSSSSEAMRRNAAAAAAAGGISSSISSAAGSAENVAATGPPSAASYAPSALSDSSSYPKPTDSVWVYVTIQLYSIEKDFYLVDFKCAGYERLLRRLSRRRFDRSSHASDADLAAPHTSATSGAAAATIAAISEDEPLKEAFSAKKEEAVVEAPVIGPNGFIESDFPPESPGEQQYDDRGEELFPAGRLAEEKEISSPFPFLDVASRLIIQLAEAHD